MITTTLSTQRVPTTAHKTATTSTSTAVATPASPLADALSSCFSPSNHLLAEDPCSGSPSLCHHQSTDSHSSASFANNENDNTHRIRAKRKENAQETESAGRETGGGGTWTETTTCEVQRCNSSNVVCSSCPSSSSSHHQTAPHPSSATNDGLAAIRPRARRTRPPLWSCFLGCGKSYKKSSGRSIRRHVLACYREHHQAECEGITNEQLNGLIAVKEKQGELQTGLRTWRLRRQPRSAVTLPSNERWQCPNRECDQCYRLGSVKSIAKHQVMCIHNPRKHLNLHSIKLFTAATQVLRDAQATNSSYQTHNTLQIQQFQLQQPGTAYSPHLQITLQPLQQHPFAMMSVTPLSVPLTAGVPSAQYAFDAANVTPLAESSAPLQLLPVQPRVALNPTALPLVGQSVTSLGDLSGYSSNVQHYLQSIQQQNYTLPTAQLAPPLLSPYPQPTALSVASPPRQVLTPLGSLAKSRSAFKKPSLTAHQQE